MKNLSEIKPFVDEQEIFAVPDVRIIGVAERCELHTGNNDDVMKAWQRFCEDDVQAKLESLPRFMANGFIAWTGDCPEGSKHYTYMPSVICPAGTPVPEGLDYRDLPASYTAKGEYGDDIGGVISKFEPLGFATCYNDFGWNAELYLDEEEDNPPRENCSPFRWLVPCMNKGN